MIVCVYPSTNTTSEAKPNECLYLYLDTHILTSEAICSRTFDERDITPDMYYILMVMWAIGWNIILIWMHFTLQWFWTIFLNKNFEKQTRYHCDKQFIIILFLIGEAYILIIYDYIRHVAQGSKTNTYTLYNIEHIHSWVNKSLQTEIVLHVHSSQTHVYYGESFCMYM